MNIRKGQKSQGTEGTEGTRVHQDTDAHPQTKDKNLKVQKVRGRGYTKVQVDIIESEF